MSRRSVCVPPAATASWLKPVATCWTRPFLHHHTHRQYTTPVVSAITRTDCSHSTQQHSNHETPTTQRRTALHALLLDRLRLCRRRVLAAQHTTTTREAAHHSSHATTSIVNRTTHGTTFRRGDGSGTHCVSCTRASIRSVRLPEASSTDARRKYASCTPRTSICNHTHAGYQQATARARAMRPRSTNRSERQR
jgi:hypothetical protein